jgi:hypothetical protein
VRASHKGSAAAAISLVAANHGEIEARAMMTHFISIDFTIWFLAHDPSGHYFVIFSSRQ